MHQDKPTVEEIIVVEGRDDTAAIRKAVDAVTIETHGFGIRQEVWDMIGTASRTKGIIVFTDPDTAGEQIRRRILDRFPEAREAFLDQRLATKDGDIGIENASPESIRQALAKARGPADQEKGRESTDQEKDRESTDQEKDREKARESENRQREDAFTSADMFRWGLDGVPGASKLRGAMGMRLGIGQATAKTFLRRLNRFGISREEVETALNKGVSE